MQNGGHSRVRHSHGAPTQEPRPLLELEIQKRQQILQGVRDKALKIQNPRSFATHLDLQ